MRLGTTLFILVGLIAVPSCNKRPQVDLSTPKQALKTLAGAMYDGDSAKARECVLPGHANDVAVDVGTKISTSMRRATDAIFKRFGESIKSDNGQPVDPNRIDPTDVDTATETVNGDEATLVLGRTHKSVTLHKTDGKWKVDLKSWFRIPDDDTSIKFAQSMLDAMSAAADEVASDVESGKYQTAQAAVADMVARMKGALERETNRLTDQVRQGR